MINTNNGGILDRPTQEQVQKVCDKIAQNIVDNNRIEMLVAIKNRRIEIMNGLNPIISQICDCFLIQADIAAITLTNHLAERMLKQAIIIKKGEGKTYSDSDSIDKIFKAEVENCDDKKMDSTIDCAKSLGLISKDEAKIMKQFKDKFRNPYSHANNNEIFKDVTQTISVANFKSPKDVKTLQVEVSTTPLLQETAIVEICKRTGFDYFFNIYLYIISIEEKLSLLYR